VRRTEPGGVLLRGCNLQSSADIRSRIMTTDDTTPKVNGRDLKVVRIDGPNGLFEVAYGGGNSEGEHAFFYRDTHGRFFFYAELFTSPPKHWDVTRATTELRTGSQFKTRSDLEAVFRKNIEYFLGTRDWMSPDERMDASVAQRPVSFLWNIVQ
jgi:hypothetical protein